jgi:nicotinamidase-related amidase
MKLGRHAAHLCIDMQRLFTEQSEWAMPWAPRVLPQIVELARHHAPRTLFTRFMPPSTPQEMRGTWRRYYERWQQFTRSRLDERLLDLVPPLQALVPPAEIIDKKFYSGFTGTTLSARLAERSIRSLVVTGGETDVCVLATTLAAVDRGYTVVLVRDALCSAQDQTHDALMTAYCRRFTEQIEVVTTEEVLRDWDPTYGG